jgi:hypothetical protein
MWLCEVSVGGIKKLENWVYDGLKNEIWKRVEEREWCGGGRNKVKKNK